MRLFAERSDSPHGGGSTRTSSEYAIWNDTVVPGIGAWFSGAWVVASCNLPTVLAVPAVGVSLVGPPAALLMYDFISDNIKGFEHQAKSYAAIFLLSALMSCSNAEAQEIYSLPLLNVIPEIGL